MKYWHKNEKQEKINGREKAMTGKEMKGIGKP